jgi:hypothetical protein
MIWLAIIAFILSAFVFGYYYNMSNTSTDFSLEHFLIGYFGSMVVLFISFMYIWYSVLNTYVGLALVLCALLYFGFRKEKK